MKIDTVLKAALLGFGLTVASGAVLPVQADTLRVVQGVRNTALSVPMNRAVVVESDVPFAELSIANPEIADISSLSDSTIYVLGRTPGTTTMTILDGNGRLISNVDVRVAPDVSEFKERLGQILPGEKIEVRTANDGIVLSGVVSSAAKLARALELAERYAPERVSNLMSVGGVQQVMLKVRFAEMQRSVAKSLRSSVSVSGDVNNDRLGVRAGSGSLLGQPVGPGTTIGTDVQGGFLLGFNAGSVEVGILLEALEDKGVVRTLAEPNLTALSGQEASFLAGGEYPVPSPGEDGTVSIEYRPFGIDLSFIPRVVDGDLINLELDASVSSLDTANGITLSGITINAFRTRSTSTTVELRDGESFAIAGLLQDDFRDSIGQIPWLGDIPVLGSLFRSSSYARQQSELVVIVTPHLVTPTKGETLALPTDRVTPPTEKDLFLNGRTTAEAARIRRAQKGPISEVAKQDFAAPYGYVLD